MVFRRRPFSVVLTKQDILVLRTSRMRLLPSDPDVETIVGRIKSGDIDLQPEFQRGEVWSKLKKQRLIDSILRDWHVPPIHVIENPQSQKQEVLDGQQRLAAIRDFVDGQIRVDGTIEPLDPAIQQIDGKLYRDLPEPWRRRFNQFTIRVFRIVDYLPSEPSEIFFRLNQPASLTGAEQRNAFFGPVREQIKELVKSLEIKGLDKGFLGFSNSRMAYDDVLSRTALAIERRSLDEKITSGDLADLYRTDRPLHEDTIDLISSAIGLFAASKRLVSDSLKFNKATAFSWLMFLVRAKLHGHHLLSTQEFARFLKFFEKARGTAAHDPESTRLFAGCAPGGRLFSIYESRSSARVADVSSVILRDAVIWLALEESDAPGVDLVAIGIKKIHRSFDSQDVITEDDLLARRLIENGWGKLA
jgi:hypothetical protein